MTPTWEELLQEQALNSCDLLFMKAQQSQIGLVFLSLKPEETRSLVKNYFQKLEEGNHAVVRLANQVC